MSRGRKAKNAFINLEREQIYHKFKGYYFQYIISQLAKKTEATLTDNSANMLLKKITAEKEALIRDKKIKQGKLQEAELQSELIFEIPKNWVWCKLDDICLNITDGTHQTPTYTETGRPFISAQHVKPFKFTPYKYKHISEEAYQECIKSGKPELGDILVTRVGAIGEAAVIDSNLEFAYYVSVGLVQPFKEHVISQYLEFVINSPYGNLYSKGNVSSKGSSAGNFNLGRIRSFLIPLPPYCEQQMILDFLNDFENDNLDEDKVYFDKEIEDKVIKLFHNQLLGNLNADELTHQLTLVKKLRQQLLQDAVQGRFDFAQGPEEDEPASELLKKIKTEKEKLIAEKKLKKEKELPPIKPEEIPFEIPENWVWCRLGEIIKISSGDGLTSSQMDKNGEIPVYGGNGINGCHNKFNIVKETIVIGRVGYYCGCVHLTEKKAWVTDNAFTVFYSEQNINRDFLIQLLKWADLGKQQFAGSQPVISGQRIYPKLIPLPPLAEQHRIVQKLDELMQYCNELEASIKQSQAQNEKLLQQVLREALRPKAIEV
jgi:type I restriction enzyme S subunit